MYGHGRFKAFTYKEMWEWYKYHKLLRADPQAGTAHERKQAQEAYESVRHWLGMNEGQITSKSFRRFRKYILDKVSLQPNLPKFSV